MSESVRIMSFQTLADAIRLGEDCGMNQTVTVFGATGHTGQFVVAELHRRGWSTIASGRDAARLEALSADKGATDVRVAGIDDPASLDRAVAGASVVINVAGPFADTAAPVIEAALRAGIPYVDVAAEVEAVADTHHKYDVRAREAGITILPAMAFYGGLGDLLATAAMGDWETADEIHLAYALSSWRPTAGTRASGVVSKGRREGRRLVYADGRLQLRDDAAPVTTWTFPDPIGVQEVAGDFTTADSVTIPRHLRTAALHSYMTTAAIQDLFAADPAPPTATDESGRSAQTFMIEVVARSAGEERRAVARGRDIYAVTAPLVVEATTRLLDTPSAAGVFAPGELFDAAKFLQSLDVDGFTVELP